MAFFSTLDAKLPNDVVEQIAEIVHRNNMEPVLADIRSFLRRALSDAPTELVPYLRQNFPNITWGASGNVFYVYSMANRLIVYTMAKTLYEYTVLRRGKTVELTPVAAYGNDVPLPNQLLPYFTQMYKRKVIFTKTIKPQALAVDWNNFMRDPIWSIRPWNVPPIISGM
jgi:hypothetical protein